jgi:thioredoxin-related protein
MSETPKFKYRVVFFKQPSCPACEAMKPIWAQSANEISEEYPHYKVGFGEWDVTSDDWEFCDKIECDGTPNFAVFDEEGSLLGLNTDGMLSPGQLKDFITNSINND